MYDVSSFSRTASHEIFKCLFLREVLILSYNLIVDEHLLDLQKMVLNFRKRRKHRFFEDFQVDFIKKDNNKRCFI